MFGAQARRPTAKKNPDKKEKKKVDPPPPGWGPSSKAAAGGADGSRAEAGAMAAVVEAFVRLAKDPDPEAPAWSTYDLVAPSQLLWSMRSFVQLQDMQRLEGARAAGGSTSREHHRCLFHTENHGRQQQVNADGLSLRSGNGPTTVLSHTSASKGVLSWTLKYGGGNTSCMIGLVKAEFGANGPQGFDIPLDVPQWSLCSAHGYEGQGHTRFVVGNMVGESFRCIADLDDRTFRVWSECNARLGL